MSSEPLSETALTGALSFEVVNTGAELGTALPTARALAMVHGLTLAGEPSEDGVRLVLTGGRRTPDALA